MLLFDVLALSVTAGLARSGWRRGFTSFVTDLVGFTSALALAVRLYAHPAAAFRWLGLSDGWAALAGGLTIFVPLIVLTAYVGSKLGLIASKPGLHSTNRVAGLAAGLAWALAVLTFALLLARAAPAPDWMLRTLGRSPAAHGLLDERSPLPGILAPLAERTVGRGPGSTQSGD